MATRRWTRFAAWRGKRIRGKVCLGLLAWLGAGLFARAELPVVAVHDSELTRALETAPAGAGTPAGTGFQWWPTTWHYFVMPESVKETLRSDGTAYAVVSDAQIAAGNLIDSNGYPVYPIVISLASEAISDSEVGALTNYVAAGGFLMVGSSAFTRHPDGSTRGDFAFANQLGLHMTTGGLTNWTTNATLSKVIAHRLVSHLPGGMLVWGMPSSADEIPNGTSPAHTQPGSHAIWQVTPADAQVIAVGDASPYLLAKPYGKGMFIYDAAMQPLLGHGGFAPGMYAYGILRKAIEWAFESASVPVPKLSPWPYAYDAAFMIRHDLGNSQIDISNIVNSAQFEATYGAKGDYFFATGTLWQEMSNSPAIIGSLQQAVSNYFATLGPQNGGLSNPVNASLTITNFDYWGWGPDEALDLSGNHQTSLGLGGTYAYNSLSNAFTEIEGWLGPLTNGLRSSAVPYYNATRDGSYQLEEQLGVKITGEQKLGPFPSWVLSTSLQTPGKRYPFITLPTSDWYLSQWYYEGWHVADSIDAGHVDGSIQDLVDFYYGMGALINLDCHTLVTDAGSAGWLPRGYLTYSLLSGLHPRLWSANSASIYSWWMQRGNAQVTASCSTNGTQPSITLTIAGATDPGTAVEALLPGPAFYGVSVRTNGVAAATNAYRINGQAVKVLVGTSVTNAQISYTLAPIAQDDTYFTSANGTLDVPAAGIVANDRTGSGGGLIPSLQTGATFGKLVLTNNGGFSYTPVSNYVGVDSFTYRLSDGVTNSSSATVTLDVAPPGSLFFDDFTRQFNASPLAPWQPALGGWTITNGVLQGTGSTVGYADLYVNGNWTNYSVQARIQLPTGAWAGGLDGRLNPLTGSKYTANIYPETSPGGTRLILELLKFHLWTTLSGMTSTPLSVVGTNWHTLKLTFQGNRIRVYFDSLMMIDATDLGYDGEPPYLTGGVGAHLFGLGASFDDFNVMPLPLTPVATDDSFTVGANTLLTNAAPGILINDTPGLGTNLTALLVAGTKNGSLTLNGDGSFGYMPATNFVGTDTFTYQVNDGLTNSTVATVTITVLPGPPQANNQLFAAVVNTMLNVASPGVLTNDWSGTATA